MNAAQISLTRLKLGLLGDTTKPQRLAILGHRPAASDERASELKRRLREFGADKTALGPIERVAELGPDFCGRYEWVFARLRDLLKDHKAEIEALLALSDLHEQARRVEEGSVLGTALASAFADTMELSNLVAIFGSDATANRIRPFSEHFFIRTQNALERFPAANNPFLHQIFLGCFPGPVWDWLDLPPQAELCPLEFTVAEMGSFLASLADQRFDLIHLSNILDWLSPAAATSLLADAFRCLSPGGSILIRQLNSTLDIPGLASGFRWDRDLSQQFERDDRSFFYRAIHVGTRP